MRLQIRCPAKINLFLSVGPKDARHYHPIRTVFQTIDLCDEMTVETGNDRHVVTFEGASIPPENTVTKALRLMSELIDLPPLDVHIYKRIPAESGLGGGSSNAAAMIRAAERITGTTLPAAEKQGIAEAIGMDVPFFLTGGRARAEGYGEKVTPEADRACESIVVTRPHVGCNTAYAYRELDKLDFEWRAFPEADELFNDFERVAPQESLDHIEAMMKTGARDAGLSGSGSAVFGRFDRNDEALAAAVRLKEIPNTSVWVCRTMTRAESLAF